MIDDTEYISRKTWSRNIETVNKIGYMNGAANGQASVFQTSFDMGYKQGFSFGLKFGIENALKSLQREDTNSNDQNYLRDPRKINCQLCLNGIPAEQNVVNLFNTQLEKNSELIKHKQQLQNVFWLYLTPQDSQSVMPLCTGDLEGLKKEMNKF